MTANCQPFAEIGIPELKPYLFIGVGATDAMFTLRMFVPAKSIFTEDHVDYLFNLGRIPEIAYAKAQAYATRTKMELATDLDELSPDRRKILRSAHGEGKGKAKTAKGGSKLAIETTPNGSSKAETFAAEREAARLAREERYQAMKTAHATAITVEQVMPFGKYTGVKFVDIPSDYINYLMENAADSDDAISVAIRDTCKLLGLGCKPNKTGHVGTVGEKTTLDVIVYAKFCYESFYGVIVRTMMKDLATGNCVTTTGKWSGEVDKTYKLACTIKAHNNFREQDQTEIIRVKEKDAS